MKDSSDRFLLWHLAICCVPLLLIYLGIFGTASVLGWLTSWPVLVIAGLAVLGLLCLPTNRAKHRNEK